MDPVCGAGGGGEDAAVLPFDQGFVELDQCRRPDQRTKLREPVRTHEQRGQAEVDAIDGSEIERPLPGAITDEQLVLEQQGLGGDGAVAAGAKELREGDQQVDGEDEDFTHRANRTKTASTCKTARRARTASHYGFATHKWRGCRECCVPSGDVHQHHLEIGGGNV